MKARSVPFSPAALRSLIGIAGSLVFSMFCSGLCAPAQLAAADFANFLTQRDLAFKGTVLSVDTVTVRTLGGCGLGVLGPYQALDLRLQVDQVLAGVADDSTVTLTTLVRPAFQALSQSREARVVSVGVAPV